ERLALLGDQGPQPGLHPGLLDLRLVEQVQRGRGELVRIRGEQLVERGKRWLAHWTHRTFGSWWHLQPSCQQADHHRRPGGPTTTIRPQRRRSARTWHDPVTWRRILVVRSPGTSLQLDVPVPVVLAAG